jgi:hypothetical protein
LKDETIIKHKREELSLAVFARTYVTYLDEKTAVVNLGQILCFEPSNVSTQL